MASYVEILKEVALAADGAVLCFQRVIYHHPNRESEFGFRFIWRDLRNNLLAHRGQARIPNPEILMTLVGKAAQEGWLTPEN